jgi:regulator of protease activity HflC (stomatin/prohibitin superfamily)
MVPKKLVVLIDPQSLVPISKRLNAEQNERAEQNEQEQNEQEETKLKKNEAKNTQKAVATTLGEASFRATNKF